MWVGHRWSRHNEILLLSSSDPKKVGGKIFFQVFFICQLFIHSDIYHKFFLKPSQPNALGLQFTTNIIKIVLVNTSFCLRHYVQNGISYMAEET